MFTLAHKHNKSKSWAYKIYGENVRLKIALNFFTELPSRDYVSNLSQKFLIDESFLDFNLITIFNYYKIRLDSDKSSFSKYIIQGYLCNSIEKFYGKQP